MKNSAFLEFLYNTACGRLLLKLLTRPFISKLAGAFMDSGLSRPLIAPFMRKNRISLEGIEIPEKGFSSFNAFFTRKRKEVLFSGAPGQLCSPCDCYASVYSVDENSSFLIKHTRYSLKELLGSDELAERYSGGTAFILRLTPADYHRYGYFDSGEILESRRIDGVLHCVRPIATESFPVYIRNSREYIVFRSDNFGQAVQMEIGALLVGRITNSYKAKRVLRGEEKGFFEFGGSTIFLLFEKEAVRPRSELAAGINSGAELQLRQGEMLGESGMQEGTE